ncbi:MAG: DUF2505 domain-containing protein [Varibaculum cambriense]|nr:DUF2505 domain-containing protein [Varibaculum cambriense]
MQIRYRRKEERLRDFELEVEYPASPARVCQILTDPQFLEFRWRQISQVKCEVQVEQAGSETFVSRAKVDLAELKTPATYARLLPDQLEIEVVENWLSSPCPDRIAHGDFEVRFGKVPVQVKAKSLLEASPQGAEKTMRKISGTLQVNMPLIGGKVERELLSHLQIFSGGEEAAARLWLANNAG